MGCENGLRALLLLLLLIQGYSSKITFPIESSDSSPKFVRSLEITDSSENELYSPERKLRENHRWNGWSFETEKDPDEKTISFQLLDEDPYQHGRPAWPHDEYLLGLVDLNRYPSDFKNSTTEEVENVENNNQEDLTKYYEWKRLQPRPPQSAFIGPGFYDVGSSSNFYDSSSPEYYRYQPTHQAIHKDGNKKIQNINSNNNVESVPGTASESTTNTRGFPYVPYDFYKRKRLRLAIHPGLIAAPLAGIAAFGAASALTSKPLLLELGYVRNKPDAIGGGWGWAGTGGHGYRPYPPFYPPPNPPPIIPPHGTASLAPGGFAHGHAGGGGGPIYPILRPTRGRPESDRSSWWNPFSALTPRLVIE